MFGWFRKKPRSSCEPRVFNDCIIEISGNGLSDGPPVIVLPRFKRDGDGKGYFVSEKWVKLF